MALQIWLPLNDNLDNQGLTNVTVTNNGTTIDNNGKLGKCYKFYESGAKITNTLSSSVTSAVGTMSCWVKFNSFPSSGAWYCLMQLGTIGGFANCRLGLYMQYQTGIVVCINASSDNNLYTHSLNTNQWYHLCTTFDGTIVRLYIDGIEVWNKTASIGSYKGAASTLFIGGTNNYYFKGYMNDVRYYSTALSPKEVEVLSRGLVCHYPLNGGGRGGDNIMPNSYIMQLGSSSVADGIWRLAGTSNMNRSRVQIDDGFYAFENSGIQTANDGSCYGIDNFVFEANTTYTMSMIARITEGTEGYAGFAPQNATIIGGTHTKVDKGYSVTPLTTAWKRIYITFTTTSSTTRNIYIGVTTGSTSVTTQMALVKIEKGDKSTPWIPKSTDTEYTKMGYNSTTEYDVSGYKNNGTKNGTFTYSSDTARYSVCSVFNGLDNSIKIPFDTFFPNATTFTTNLWFKKTELGSKNYESLWGGVSGFEMDTRSGSSNTLSLYMASTRSGNVYSPFEFNKWYMVTMVNDGTNELYYVNGELVKTITKKAMPSGGYWIGAWNSSTGQNLKGQMSDFRIYATALSADQIAELYNTAVSVANNGTLMGYELVEV